MVNWRISCMVMISAARSSNGVVADVHQLFFRLSTLATANLRLSSGLSTLITTSGGLISTRIFGQGGAAISSQPSAVSRQPKRIG
jgi:hypothetical protein